MKTTLSQALVSLVVATSWIPAALSGPVKVERAAEAVNYNAVAPHYVAMRKVEGASPLSDRNGLTTSLYRATGPDVGVPEATKALPKAKIRNMKDVYFVVDVQVGSQTIPLHVDTGSSDTWLIADSFQCLDRYSRSVASKNCGFAKGFSGALAQGTLPDERFGVMYGDDTFVQGYFGFDDVTIGGLTAKHQQLGMVNRTYWFSRDSKSSGLLGLAYPFMTGLDNSSRQYDPLFTTLWKQNLTKPMFSLALSRDSADPKKSVDSYLAFGGVPPTSVIEYDESSWAGAAIRPLRTLDTWGVLDSDDNGLYVIKPDAWVYGKEGQKAVVNTTAAKDTVAIDAGSTLSILPHDLAQEIYKMFDPPAAWYPHGGGIFANCNATTPKVGMRLGDKTFYFSPADLLRQNDRDLETGTKCLLGIQDPYVGPYILGITFLSNVVAVFDVGNQEMRFAQRKDY